MDDEAKAILREILATQKEHLSSYHAYAEKALKIQESVLHRQKVALRFVAFLLVLLGAFLVLIMITNMLR